MDRKGIAGIALALIILVAWEFYYVRAMRTAAAARAAAFPAAQLTGSAGASPAPPTTGTGAAALSDAGTPQAPTPATPSVPEQTLVATGPAGEYTFTNLGGGIAKAVLPQYMAEKGKVVLNEYGADPIGAVTRQPGVDAQDPYTVTKQGGSVVCSRTGPDQVEIVKSFALPTATTGKDQYLIPLDITFTNHSSKPVNFDGYFVGIGSAAFIHHGDRSTYTGFNFYKGKFIDVNWFSAKTIPLVGIQRSPAQAAYVDAGDGIVWAGVTSQYFTTILSGSGNPGKRVWAARFPVKAEGTTTPLYGIEGALGTAPFTLAPGQSQQQHFVLYCGPKQYGILRQLGNDEEEMMNFNWTKPISIFLLSFMNWLKSILGNYVAAIVIMTVIIKSVLWIPQNAATKSMKKMQALQPRMTELREKYADAPDKMNQELMKLYKDYGVNPFAGCLPMLIQIPIFFGFFNMLGGAVELRGSGFLWVKDLSQPDTIATIAGYHINLLPLIMASTMLWQMSITPKTGDPAQQKIFMFMPLIFVFFCYSFASALSLYYTVQNLFSIAQLYVTRNQQVPTLQKLTATRKKRRGPP